MYYICTHTYTYTYACVYTHTHLTVNSALFCTCDVLPMSMSPYLEFYETSERNIRFLLIFLLNYC